MSLAVRTASVVRMARTTAISIVAGFSRRGATGLGKGQKRKLCLMLLSASQTDMLSFRWHRHRDASADNGSKGWQL